MGGDSSPAKVDFVKAASADNIAFMELATGPPADLLLRQCGLLPLPTSRSGASPLHILDNACGAGIVTQKIMEDLNSIQSHLSVICGDLSPPMLDVAKCRIQAGRWPAEIKTIDVLAIPYDDSTFDYVLTNFQLQFLPTPELAMIEAHRVLKTGGKASFTVWKSVGWLCALQAVAPDLPLPPFFTSPWATEDQLRPSLAALGYTDIKIETLDFNVKLHSTDVMSDFMRGAMASLMADGVGDKLERWLRAEYGDGPFECPGWTAMAVTGTVVKG